MARDSTERHDVIPTLGELFRENGFSGTSLADITHRTGLGKGSLYHFFTNGKKEMAHLKIILNSLLITILSYPISLFAYDISDSFSVESTVTAVGQHADFNNVFNEDGNKVSDTDRSTVVIDIGANFHPTENDEFQITYSFAEREAINGVEAFSLAPFQMI